jgi:DNA transformation protein
MTDELTQLPNIGQVLAQKLRRAGIASYDDLVDLGSVEAYLRIWDRQDLIGYNMLYALEGAIQGVRWHDLPTEQRQRVKAELLRALKRDTATGH